jgi:hypothetical protein
MNQTNLPRQVVFAVLGLEVLDGISSDLLLVEPDLGIGVRLGKEVLGQVLRELEDLVVKMRHGRVSRALDVSVDVSASGDSVEKRSVDCLHGGLEVLLD